MTTNYDNLGRVTGNGYTEPGNASQNYNIAMQYDAYDHPVVIDDSRLLMASLGGRKKYLVYDSFGRVIKQLEPELVSLPGQYRVYPGETEAAVYKDYNRPYTETTYDRLGRKLIENRLLVSSDPIAPSTLASASSSMPAGAQTAVNLFTYDAFDRLSVGRDADNYSSYIAYDSSDKPLTVKSEVCRVSDTICTAQSITSDGGLSVTTTFAYDAAGRTVLVIDPLGHKVRTTYNALGKPITEGSPMTVAGTERYVASKVYGYSDDGLLVAQAEPDNDPSTTAVPTDIASSNTAPSGYVLTKRYGYDNRIYATSMDTLAPNLTTGSAMVTTLYRELDYLGRPKFTDLPAVGGYGPTLEQRYDSRGNLVYMRDEHGFETQTSYDANNRVLSEIKRARTSNTTDAAAFTFGSGLQGIASYNTYDLSGNLVQRTEGGLTTYYMYNTLSKVVAESRPKSASTDTRPYLLKAYRLDGATIAETTLDYGGGLRNATNPSSTLNATSSLMPTAGNIRAMTLDARGLIVEERSLAPTNSLDGLGNGTVSFNGIESIKKYTYNGVKLRITRDFTGDRATYTKNASTITGPLIHLKRVSRAGISELNPTSYLTYWRYDALGRLHRNWDVVAGEEQNVFDYTFTATGKEATQLRTVTVETLAKVGSATPSQVVLGSGTALINSKYNERDQLTGTDINEVRLTGVNTSIGNNPLRFTRYTYFLDGSKSGTSVAYSSESNVTGAQTYSYDARGRETTSTDSNGAASNANLSGSTTTTTTYDADGTVTKKLVDGTGKCKYQETTVPTLNAQAYSRTEWQWVAKTAEQSTTAYREVVCGDAKPTRKVTIKYDINGRPTQQDTVLGDQTTTTTLQDGNPADSTTKVATTTTNTFNDYGDLGSQAISVNQQTDGYAVSSNTTTSTSANPDVSAADNTSGVTRCGHTIPAGTAAPAENCTTSHTTYSRSAVTYTNTTKTTTASSYTAAGVLNSKGISTVVIQNSYPGDASTDSVSGEPNGTLSYALDSKGNRLRVFHTDGSYKYNGYAKLYDADERTAEFNRPNDGGVEGSDGAGTYTNTYKLAFRYDPKGNQVLSADAGVREYPNNTSYYLVSRQVYSTIEVDGHTQVIHAQAGATGKTRTCPFIFCWFGSDVTASTWDTPAQDPSGSSYNRIQDESFGLSDGLADQAWDTIKPFAVIGGGAVQPLETPQTPFSANAGFEPSNVTAPGLGTAPINPEPVRPPNAGSGSTASASTPSNKPASSPAAPPPSAQPQAGQVQPSSVSSMPVSSGTVTASSVGGGSTPQTTAATAPVAQAATTTNTAPSAQVSTPNAPGTVVNTPVAPPANPRERSEFRFSDRPEPTDPADRTAKRPARQRVLERIAAKRDCPTRRKHSRHTDYRSDADHRARLERTGSGQYPRDWCGRCEAAQFQYSSWCAGDWWDCSTTLE